MKLTITLLYVCCYLLLFVMDRPKSLYTQSRLVIDVVEEMFSVLKTLAIGCWRIIYHPDSLQVLKTYSLYFSLYTIASLSLRCCVAEWCLCSLSCIINIALIARGGLHVMSAVSAARDLHSIAPRPLEHMFWRQFVAPFNAIIIITIIIIDAVVSKISNCAFQCNYYYYFLVVVVIIITIDAILFIMAHGCCGIIVGCCVVVQCLLQCYCCIFVCVLHDCSCVIVDVSAWPPCYCLC